MWIAKSFVNCKWHISVVCCVAFLPPGLGTGGVPGRANPSTTMSPSVNNLFPEASSVSTR